MRLVVRRWAGSLGIVALVSLGSVAVAQPRLHPKPPVGTTAAANEAGLPDLWDLFDGIADKSYHEQAYRDAAGISVLSYLIAAALEDHEKTYSSAQRVAFCYHFLGDTEPALHAYWLALNCAIPNVPVRFTDEDDDPAVAKLDTQQRVVRTLMNLGVLCVNARKVDAAETYFLRAIRLTELEAPSTEMGRFYVEHLGARAKTGLADTYQDKGDYGRAVKVYQECQAIFEAEYHYLQLRERRPGNVKDRASMLAATQQNLAHCLRNLGEAYMDSRAGSLPEAKACLEESLVLRKEIGNNVLIADSELALSELAIAEHRFDDALPLSVSAASRTAPDSAGDNPDTYWQALLCQGKSLLELGRTMEAAIPLQTAIRVVEGLRDPDVGEEKRFFDSVTWFFRQKVAPYVAMAELCIRQDKPLEALRYAELAKARTLLLGRPLDAVDREESLGAISLTSEELCGMLAEAVPDDRTAALEYLFGTDRGYVFLVTRSATDTQPSVKVAVFETEKTVDGLNHGSSGDNLYSAVEAFRSRLEKSYTAYPTRLAWALYEKLVQPFASELANKEHLVVVPAENLWRIPFESLSTSPTQPSYLISKYAITYTPSLIFLARLINRASKEQQNPRPVSLVLADPRLAEPSPVVNAVDSFSAVFTTKAGFFESRWFTGGDATRRCFLEDAPSAQLILLATHAVSAGNNPVESFFALAPESGVDLKGRLTAADIMSERLSANLAILCACETEKGRYVEGEGEIGCGWAFLYAGCASTLVSQWRVDRDATFKLTSEFCHGLDRDLTASVQKLSLAELLRSTQLALLADPRYAHPFYWAGIVLVGDPLWRTGVARSNP
jgi:CHAT domain-containing protein